MISANTHGPTKFITPGSMTVKIEGKAVHLLGEPMMNNGGPSGSPPNSATMMGVQGPSLNKGKEECLHGSVRRDPPKGSETRTTEEQAKDMDDEADRLEALGNAKLEEAASAPPSEAKALRKSGMDSIKGAGDKRFEARLARDTRAKETNIKVYCNDCGMLLAEFDVVTNSGVHKECKSSGSAVDVSQLYKEINLAALPAVGAPGTIVHLAIPGGERKAALKRFVRPHGRKMTNKGAGYDRVIQEH